MSVLNKQHFSSSREFYLHVLNVLSSHEVEHSAFPHGKSAASKYWTHCLKAWGQVLNCQHHQQQNLVGTAEETGWKMWKRFYQQVYSYCQENGCNKLVTFDFKSKKELSLKLITYLFHNLYITSSTNCWIVFGNYFLFLTRRLFRWSFRWCRRICSDIIKRTTVKKCRLFIIIIWHDLAYLNRHHSSHLNL